MPRGYYIHATPGVLRRRKRRRVALVGLLVVTFAFSMSSLINGWQWMSNGAAHRPDYAPRDFERTALLAGEKLGSENPDMTTLDVRKFNERELRKDNPQNVGEKLRSNSFAFEAGFSKTSNQK